MRERDLSFFATFGLKEKNSSNATIITAIVKKINAPSANDSELVSTRNMLNKPPINKLIKDIDR